MAIAFALACLAGSLATGCGRASVGSGVGRDPVVQAAEPAPLRTYPDDVRPADDLLLPARGLRIEPNAEDVESRTLRLTHGTCGFVELEDEAAAERAAGTGHTDGPDGNGDGDAGDTDGRATIAAPDQATCRDHNRQRFGNRARNTLVVPAGRWTIVVHNPYDDRPLGFWLREEKDARTTLVSAGGVVPSRPGTWDVVLWPGTFLVSCPLSPSPDYLLVVE